MKRFNKRFIVLSGLLLLFILGYTQITQAISINPSRAEFVVEPNKKYLSKYSIINTDAKKIKVKIFAEKCNLFEKGGDATSWIKISPAEVTIPENSSKTVNCIVKVPNGMKGEYTASLVFRSLSPTRVEMLDITAQISLVTYVIIKGTEIVDVEISDIEILNAEPLKINVKLKNSGNIHVRPKGKAEIIKILKSGAGYNEIETATLVLNPNEHPIFPDIDGVIVSKDADIKLEPGSYKARVELEFTPDFILNKETEFIVTDEKEIKME